MNIVGTRLEELRVRLSMNWGELAKHLQLSRAMLDFLRSGGRDASPKTMRRLMEAERACGIVPPEDFSLPKEKLEKLEFGIPGDSAQLHEGARKAREHVDLIKSIQQSVRAETRSVIREEMSQIRKEILAEIEALLIKISPKRGAK